MKNIFVLLIIFLIPILSNAEDFTKEDMAAVHKSSCRVCCFKKGSTQGSLGSGIVCARSGNQFLILTNAHVVEGCDVYRCDWFHEGKKVSSSAKLVKKWRIDDGSADFALLIAESSELLEYDPPIIPPGPETYKPDAGSKIYSSGCPSGRWASVWAGTIENYYGTTAQFYPAPLPGQSGSAIVQRIGGELSIAAILTWRVGDEKKTPEENMRGGSIPICNLWSCLKNKRPTGRGNSVPPDAVTVTDKNIPEFSSVAIINTDKESRNFPQDTPSVRYREFSLYFFTREGCLPCRAAEIEVLRPLRSEGYQIRKIHEEQERELFDRYNVKLTPTFAIFDVSVNPPRACCGWDNNYVSNSDENKKLIRRLFEAEYKKKHSSPPENTKTIGDFKNIVTPQKPAINRELENKEKKSLSTQDKPEDLKADENITKQGKKPEIILPAVGGNKPGAFKRDDSGKLDWDMTAYHSDLIEIGNTDGGEIDLSGFFNKKNEDKKQDTEPKQEEKRPENRPGTGIIDRGLDRISGSAEKVISEKLEIFKADFFKYFDQFRNKIIFYGSLIFAGIMMIGYLFGGVIVRILSTLTSKLPRIQFVRKKQEKESKE